MADNSLKQYIDVYEEHKALIDSHSAPLMNSLRPAACEALKNCVLPKKGAENYEHTDLNEILAPDYGLNLARVPISINPLEAFRCGVPSLSTSLFMLLNDSFAATRAGRDSLPEGVEMCSLPDFCRRHPEVAEKYYGQIAPLSNPIVALDTMLAQDGVALYVPKGVKVEKTIQLVNVLNNGLPLMAVRRVLVIIEDDAEARVLVCDHTQNPELDFCSIGVVEIFAGKRSRFDWYDMEESTERTSRLNTIYTRLDEEANVMIDGITLFNGRTRNEYHGVFTAPHAELHLYGMGIEDEQRRLETYTHIDHSATDCRTDELFKYVVEDEAVGSFTGRIYVAHGASGTEAYQANRNIVGSPTARMYSKPQLEIYNDDVKCSHGCAVGQLDEMQIFYLRSRGIDEAEARLFLKQAFMADVIDAVSLPELRDRLHVLVERRFAGEKMSCEHCGGSCHPETHPETKEEL